MWWAKDDEASAGSSRSCTVLAAGIESTISTCMYEWTFSLGSQPAFEK